MQRENLIRQWRSILSRTPWLWQLLLLIVALSILALYIFHFFENVRSWIYLHLALVGQSGVHILVIGVLVGFVILMVILLYESVIRPFFWRHGHAWWGLAIPLFTQGVVFLASWTTISLLIVWLLPFLLPPPLSLSLASAGISLFVPALIGFAIQQWKVLDEEIKRWREQEEQIVKEIDELVRNCKHGEYEDAAIAYLRLVNEASMSQRTQYLLDRKWHEYAPKELQHTVKILRFLRNEAEFYRKVEDVGKEQALEALQWALEQLGERLRPQIVEARFQLEKGTFKTEYLWPIFAATYRNHIGPDGSDGDSTILVEKGLRYLGLEKNPFPSLKAEHEILAIGRVWSEWMVQAYVSPSWWDLVRYECSDVFYIRAGGGKTTTCLYFTHETLKEVNRSLGKTDSFPVYWSIRPPSKPSSQPSLVSLMAHVVTETLAYYISAQPTAFQHLEPTGQDSFVRLLRLCAKKADMGSAADFIRYIGLVPIGDGEAVLKRISEWERSLPTRDDYKDDDILFFLQRLGVKIHVFADGQEQWSADDISKLKNLTEQMRGSNICLQAFVTPKDYVPDVLSWDTEELGELLKRRLWIVGDESIDTWFKGQGPSPTEKVITAAQGSPGRLIRICRRILMKIGEVQDRLTVAELERVWKLIYR